MNLFFATQGQGLRLFVDFAETLGGLIDVGATGYYVSDAMYYRRFTRERPDFEANAAAVTKEWVVIESSAAGATDLPKLRSLETACERPGVVWEALFCDRRLMYGRLCRYTQRYHPRFDHERLMAMASTAVIAIDEAFDAVRPELVFSLVPVTFGEYLTWAIARARGIPTLFLTVTKINNQVHFAEDFFGTSARIRRRFEELRSGRRLADPELTTAARHYLRSVKSSGPVYEGMIPNPYSVAPRSDGSPKRVRPDRTTLGERLQRRLRSVVDRCSSEVRRDNHNQGWLGPRFFSSVVMPAKARLHQLRLGGSLLDRSALTRRDYAFFPLNSEPEVSLSIHTRAHVNQIEAVRAMARSLPPGMELLVKEHPRCLGYRPLSYYRKLLRIPNVRLVHPAVESRDIVAGSRIVISAWSFVPFEAVLQGKPALVLASPAFTMLPETLIRRVSNISDLPTEIAALLDEHRYDEGAIIDYLTATLEDSVPFDFFSLFLAKKSRLLGFADTGVTSVDELRAQQLDTLARYALAVLGIASPQAAER